MAGTNSTKPPAPITTPLLTRPSMLPALAPGSPLDFGLLTTPWIMWVKNVDAVLTALLGQQAGGDVTSTVEQITLTANTSITATAPTQDGNLLFVFITQDGTGGWTITWGGTFAAGAVTDVDLRANSLTVYAFVGISGAWNEFIPPFVRP